MKKGNNIGGYLIMSLSTMPQQQITELILPDLYRSSERFWEGDRNEGPSVVRTRNSHAMEANLYIS